MFALSALLCLVAFTTTTILSHCDPRLFKSTNESSRATSHISNVSDIVGGGELLPTDFMKIYNSNSTPQLAAPWIKERKVLFVELHTWDVYYGPSKYKTGEYYVSATWDYALRQNGFTVERVSTKHYYEEMTEGEILAYHRIFVRDPKWHHLYHQKEIMCKVRPMYYYGDWFYGKNEQNYRFQVPFAEKQILSAHIDARNTFMGYFPHNLLNEDPRLPNKERKKVGLLYGKKPEYFEGHEDVINALIDSGFELHSTCNNPDCPLPKGVIRHGTMPPDTYASLMKQFSFMLGFQKPEVSVHHSIMIICVFTFPY